MLVYRLVLPALLSSVCAMVFMDHVPDNYNPQEMEPQCTESSGFVLWDIGISAVDVAGLVMVSKSDGLEQDQTRALAVAFAAEGLLHAASAAIGSGWIQSCRKAREQRAEYTRSVARQSQERDRYLQALLRQVAAQQAAQQRQAPASPAAAPAAVAPSEPEPETSEPVGFYCTSKVCTRDLATCERFRAATADGTACSHVDAAFCFAIGFMRACRSTLELCQAQRASAENADSECSEEY